jgi:hypothetical protein
MRRERRRCTELCGVPISARDPRKMTGSTDDISWRAFALTLRELRDLQSIVSLIKSAINTRRHQGRRLNRAFL